MLCLYEILFRSIKFPDEAVSSAHYYNVMFRLGCLILSVCQELVNDIILINLYFSFSSYL